MLVLPAKKRQMSAGTTIRQNSRFYPVGPFAQSPTRQTDRRTDGRTDGETEKCTHNNSSCNNNNVTNHTKT